MRNPSDIVIDGDVYRVTPLPAGKGLRVFVIVAKTVSPALSKIGSLKELGDGLLEGLSAVTEKLDPDDFVTVCNLLAENTTLRRKDGKELGLSAVFDMHFAGNYVALVKWLKFALEVNLGPLPELGLAKAQSASHGAAS